MCRESEEIEKWSNCLYTQQRRIQIQIQLKIKIKIKRTLDLEENCLRYRIHKNNLLLIILY